MSDRSNNPIWENGATKNDDVRRVWAVTGSNGYVGSKIVGYLRRRNQVIYELARKAPEGSGSRNFINFSLDAGVDPDALKGVDVLVHCAYDFKQKKWPDIHRVNVVGTLRLFDIAKSAGVKRILFMSTISAYEGASSLYGKAKLEIERTVLDGGGFVIRPGLVYGKRPGGMMGALNSLVTKSPILPVLGGGKQLLYLVHEDDLADLVLRCGCSREPWARPISAAYSEPMTFSDILRVIARSRGRVIRLVPIPWIFPYMALKSAEGIGLDVGFRSDSLISLLNQNPVPDFTLPQELKVSFRKFDDSSTNHPGGLA